MGERNFEKEYMFQLTLPEWGATLQCLIWHIVPMFQLTLPEWGATYSAKIPLFIDTSKGISRTAIRESFLHR